MSNLLTFLIPAIALMMIALPLIPVYRGISTGKKAKHSIIFNICAFFGIALLMVVLPVADLVSYAAEAAGETGSIVETIVSTGAGLGYLAAALSTGMSSIGAGIAVAAAAPAAIGATSEDSSSFGKSLIFVAMGEGVALYGLIISILILGAL